MPKDKSKIVKSVVTSHGVDLTLEGGVTVRLYSHDEYIHIGFSGTKPQIVCSPHSVLQPQYDYDPKRELHCANSVNVFYTPTK